MSRTLQEWRIDLGREYTTELTALHREGSESRGSAIRKTFKAKPPGMQ